MHWRFAHAKLAAARIAPRYDRASGDAGRRRVGDAVARARAPPPPPPAPAPPPAPRPAAAPPPRAGRPPAARHMVEGRVGRGGGLGLALRAGGWAAQQPHATADV